MKRYIIVILILLVFLPITTIFIFDAKYTDLQNSVCNDSKLKVIYSMACSYPERNERERLVTTAFYRHIGDYFGRSVGTSPSWLDLDTGDANEWFALDSGDAGEQRYDIHQKIGVFNREFAASMIVSIIAASVSATLLAQQLISIRRARGKHNSLTSVPGSRPPS
jgi:hypothetical protein